MSEKLLAKLNQAQKQAVTHSNGPLLIVAGAGTGKTTVLINRLAYLVLSEGFKTEDVLLLTFTEKAAGEMSDRAGDILPYGYLDLWIHTFHGFAERILRDFALDIGLNPDFRLVNTTEQWILIKKNLAEFKLDYYRPLGNPTKFISELVKHFSRLKDEMISPEEYLQYATELESDQDVRSSSLRVKSRIKTSQKGQADYLMEETDTAKNALESVRVKELANAYHYYNQLLLQNNFLDFGDLILYALKLFKERPAILEFYRNRFRHIMVDEFQDTNLAQYELVKILAAPSNNLVVVGDDDQAIYKFRGASLSNIMQFKDDFPKAQEIVLTDNYRSRQEILDKAYQLIKHNDPYRLEVKLKIDKKLKAKSPGLLDIDSTKAVRFLNFPTRDDEISFVVDQIRNLRERFDSENIRWSDFAILVRANNTAEAYVKELNRQNIPNQFMSWRGLYYKPLIVDILSYFRLLDNYHESSALFRVLNMEIFKVAPLDIVNINKFARRKVWSSYEALRNLRAISGLSDASVKNISKLLRLIDEHSLLAKTQSVSRIFLKFVYDSGLLAGLDRDRDLETFSYLNQFYQKIKSLEEAGVDIRLKDFLEAIDLELEAGDTGALKLDFVDAETVKIMTVHSAKGLEFPYVFVVDLVDKKFPTIARGEKISLPDALVREQAIGSGNVHLAEERRLFYVAITRAKERLFLTAARDYGGARDKKPSRFIAEMDVSDSNESAIDLSAENEFLRDLHRLNEHPLHLGSKNTDTIPYPLPSKFSFSQLAAYDTCPLQYKFNFILKVPVSSDKASLIFGRVIHNTLYNFLLPFLVNQQSVQTSLFASQQKEKSNKQPKINLLSEKRLLNIYEEFWQPDGYASPKERDDYYAKGQRALQRFLTDYQQSPPEAILFLEKKFSFKLGTDILKGTIDRVDRLADGSWEIIDYKTGRPKTITDLKFFDRRQLILYQMFLEEFLSAKISRLSYYYVENGAKVSFQSTVKDRDKLQQQVATEIAAIKERRFEPKPGRLCSFCDFRDICEFRQV